VGLGLSLKKKKKAATRTSLKSIERHVPLPCFLSFFFAQTPAALL